MSRQCYRILVGHPRTRCCRNAPALAPTSRFPADCQWTGLQDVRFGQRTCFSDIVAVPKSHSSIQEDLLQTVFPDPPLNTRTTQSADLRLALATWAVEQIWRGLSGRKQSSARFGRKSTALRSRYENSFKVYDPGLELAWKLEDDS